MPALERGSRTLPTTISEEQFLTLLEHVSATSPSGLRNAAVLLVMYDAGLRVGEVCGLASGDVNRRDGLVRVRRRRGDGGRVVPLTRRTRTAIAAWEGVRGTGMTEVDALWEFAAALDAMGLQQNDDYEVATRDGFPDETLIAAPNGLCGED